jgi:hypothetical protein
MESFSVSSTTLIAAVVSKQWNAFFDFLLNDLKPKSKKSSGMAKKGEKQHFKKVVEHCKFTGNSISKKHWKSSKSSGIRVDRTHP